MPRLELRSYTPYPKQKLFHQSNAFLRYYGGGFGAGKTMAGCWEGIDVSIAYPNNLGIIARKTYRELKDSTQRTFFEICPPELIEKYIARDETIRFKNGSEILFRSLDNKDKIGRGINLGWFYIDEASELDDEDFARMLVGRLRRANVPWRGGWFTSNPPHIEHWLYDWFVERTLRLPPGQQKYFYIRASSYENPALPQEWIEALESEYSPQWVRRYLRGEFGSLVPGTPVFGDVWDEELHQVPTIPWRPDRPVFRSWDFGFHHPVALFSQLGADRTWMVMQELMGTKILLHKFAEQVVEFSNEHYPGATFIDVGDPAGRQRGDKDERTSLDILREYKINVVTRRFPKKKLIELIAQRLSMIRRNPREGTKWGAIQVSKAGCPILIEGLSGSYVWPKVREGRPAHEYPMEDGFFEHVQDALQYAAAAIFFGGFGGGIAGRIVSPRWNWNK